MSRKGARPLSRRFLSGRLLRSVAETAAIRGKASACALLISSMIVATGCSTPEFETIPGAFKKSENSTATEPAPIPDATPTPVPAPTPAPVDPTPTPAPTATPSTPTPTPTPPPVATPPPTPTPQPARPAFDTFTQNEAANKVDIMIINDNSSSMDQEQKKMAERFDSFISAIKDIDYQIAMTTTDLEGADWGQYGRMIDWEGTTTKILTAKTPNADKIFKNSVQRKETIDCFLRKQAPFCPSGNEEPLRGMMMAMDQRFTANSGFFRDKVDLVFIVLSDEDELSNGPASATKPKDVINRFQAYFGNSKRLAVHGIIIKPGDSKCLEQQAKQVVSASGAAYGTHVDELAKATGGSTWSICESDYGKNLSSISQSVRKLVGSFDLAQMPKSGSVVVTLTPSANVSWRVEGQKLIFDTPPPAGTRIDVQYTY